MNKKQFIKADLYAVVDTLILLAITLLVFYAKREEKTLLLWSQLLVALGAITALVQTQFGQAMVKNNSNQTIYIKPEEATEPEAVPPQGEGYDIDGIKANGKVYKLPDGVHATVNEKNEIKVSSITGRLIYMLGGGLQTAPKDGGWQKIFDK